MRVVVAPWFFRLPLMRRYTGYALWRTILLKRADVSDDLITHELCHIWQGQQRVWHMTFKHLTTRYRRIRTRSRRGARSRRRAGGPTT